MLLVGAASGGVLFAWLGGRIGRVRAMSLSVLVFAMFTGLCGLAAAPWPNADLRCVTALVLGVWPNRSRAFMADLIGAAANVGYLLVGVVGIGMNAAIKDLAAWLLSVGMSEAPVEILVRNGGWRLMMMLGTSPAILTVFL